MSLYRTMVQRGESLWDAVTRAAFTAGQGNYNGYSVDCEKCGLPIDEHSTDIGREFHLRAVESAGRSRREEK